MVENEEFGTAPKHRLDGEVHVYACMPIDHWAGWQRPEAVVVEHPHEHDFDSLTRVEFDRFRLVAETLALDLGWEGDFREGPFIAGMPQRQGMFSPMFMVAWKQPNNGTTFVASPYELVHLSDCPHRVWRASR